MECETADSSCRGCFPLVEEQLVLCGVMYIGGNSSLWHYFLFYRKKKAKQKREILRLKNKMYEEKINFLTNISHELRTPLTLICAPLKRIINHESGSDREVEKLLVPIYKQAHQMKNIIDMVLDVRKLEEGKDMLHIPPYSLNEWVRSVGDKFADEYRVKGIWLEYELDERIGRFLLIRISVSSFFPTS